MTGNRTYSVDSVAFWNTAYNGMFNIAKSGNGLHTQIFVRFAISDQLQSAKNIFDNGSKLFISFSKCAKWCPVETKKHFLNTLKLNVLKHLHFRKCTVRKKPVAYGKIVNINILISVQFSIDHLHKYIEIHLNYHLILLEVSHKNHLLNSHWIILPFLPNAYSLPMKK